MQFTLIPLLAADLPPAQFTHESMQMLAWMLSIGLSSFTIYKLSRSQKRDVTITSEGATKSELHGLQDKLTELSIAQAKDRDTMIHDSDERRRAIYAKIEDLRREVKSDSEHLTASIMSVRESVASLKTSAESAATGLNSLSSKIDTLLQRK